MFINYLICGIALYQPKQNKTNNYEDQAGDLEEQGQVNTLACGGDCGDNRVYLAKAELAALL